MLSCVRDWEGEDSGWKKCDSGKLVEAKGSGNARSWGGVTIADTSADH